jgi:hypothetical protein
MCLLVVGTALPASAQIYTFRAPDGQLVLSNVRPEQGAEVHSYAVPRADDVRATRAFPADDRKSSYDDLIVEHSRGTTFALRSSAPSYGGRRSTRRRSRTGRHGPDAVDAATAREFGVRNAFNPSENAAYYHLRQLLDRYDNNEQLALAATMPVPAPWTNTTHPPYRETKDYVVR